MCVSTTVQKQPAASINITETLRGFGLSSKQDLERFSGAFVDQRENTHVNEGGLHSRADNKQ